MLTAATWWLSVYWMQSTGIVVGGLAIPWSLIVTVAGGGAGWATLRADVRAAKAIAADARKAASDAGTGVNELNVMTARIETEVHNLRRELDRLNRHGEVK